MGSLLKLCDEYFGSKDFYDILNINRSASQKEIQKAYYKLSLSVHPDRVEENQKAHATEQFKILGKIHSILQDPDKRKIYDDSGDFDEESDDVCNWINYWRTLFKKITIKDIENYEKEYIGSETEKSDIKRAYVATKGNMDKMFEMIPFLNCESEPRIIETVQNLVDDGEVEYYKAFFKEPKTKKLRRMKKYKRQKEECDEIDIDEISKEIAKKQEERTQRFSDMISSIEEKYGKKSKRKAITDNNGEVKSKRVTRSKKN